MSEEVVQAPGNICFRLLVLEASPTPSVISNTLVSKPNLPVRDLQNFFLLLSKLCVLIFIQLPVMIFVFSLELPLFGFSLQQSL